MSTEALRLPVGTAVSGLSVEQTVSGLSRHGLWGRRYAKGLLGAFLLIVACLAAVAAPFVTPHDPLEQVITGRLLPPVWDADGSQEHLLGTDGLGRDLLSRIVYGARISIGVSLAATLLATSIGVVSGLLAGYFRGKLDDVIMTIVDIHLAFPFMLLALTFMAVFRPSIPSLIIVLGVSGWPGFCRIIRGQTFSVREREFVQAARALGANDLRILFTHILPNVFSVLMVVVTINIGRFILAEAALSFVGLGVSPQTPSWGLIINEGREYIWNAWWLITFPGVAIVLTVLGVGLFGDWLRYRVDPRLRV